MQIFYIFPQKVKKLFNSRGWVGSSGQWNIVSITDEIPFTCTVLHWNSNIQTSLNKPQQLSARPRHDICFLSCNVAELSLLPSYQFKDEGRLRSNTTPLFVFCFLKMSEVSVSSLIFQTWSRLGLFTYSTSFNHSFTFSETWRRNTNPDYDYLRRCEDNTWRCSRVQT